MAGATGSRRSRADRRAERDHQRDLEHRTAIGGRPVGQDVEGGRRRAGRAEGRASSRWDVAASAAGGRFQSAAADRSARQPPRSPARPDPVGAAVAGDGPRARAARRPERTKRRAAARDGGAAGAAAGAGRGAAPAGDRQQANGAAAAAPDARDRICRRSSTRSCSASSAPTTRRARRSRNGPIRRTGTVRSTGSATWPTPGGPEPASAGARRRRRRRRN